MRISFSGRTQLNILVRRPADPERQPPLLLSQLQSRLQMSPDGLAADFEFQVDILNASLDKLVFLCDPGLEPFEVTARNLELRGWQLRPGAARKGPKGEILPGPRELVVSFHNPFQGNLAGLRIRAISARPSAGAWTLPGVWLQSGLSRGEFLRLQVHPELRLAAWNPGRFRLTGSSHDAEGHHLLTLTDQQADPAVDGRPSVTLRSGPEPTALEQKSWWRLEDHQASWRSEIDVPPALGQAGTLVFKLPRAKGWTWKATTVESQPREALKSWGSDDTHLYVDLVRNHGPVQLQVNAAAPFPPLPDGALLDIPDLAPTQAWPRHHQLTIGMGPRWHGRLLQTSTPPRAPADAASSASLFLLISKDKAITGQLQVHAQPDLTDIGYRQKVLLTAGQASVQTHLDVIPRQGSARHVDFLTVGGDPSDWVLEGVDGMAGDVVLQRQPQHDLLPSLLAFGSGSGLAALCQHTLTPAVQGWKLTWTKPLDGKLSVRLRTLLNKNRHGRWDIPKLVFPQADQTAADVTFHTTGVDMLVTPRPGLNATVALRNQEAAPAAGAVFEQAELVTFIGPTDSTLTYFRCRAFSHHGAKLPVRLPAQAERLLAVRWDGRWLADIGWQPRAQDVLVEIPVPEGAGGHLLELLFVSRLSWQGWPTHAEAVDLLPHLPSPPLTVERRWRLHPSLAPLQQEGFRPVLSGPPSRESFARQAWRLGQDALADIWPTTGQELTNARRVDLLSAEVAARPALTAATTLGEALASVVKKSPEGPALVVDGPGLLGARWHPRKPLGDSAKANQRPIWENLGLVMIHMPEASLLTSSQKASWWQAESATAALRADLLQALQHGRAADGRLAALPVWLGDEETSGPKAAYGYLLEDLQPGFDSGWTEWAPAPGRPLEIFQVVNQRELAALAWVLAGGVLVVLLAAQRRLPRAWLGRLVLILLGLALFAKTTAPATLKPLTNPSLLLLSLVLAGLYVLALRGRQQPAAPSRSTDKVPRLLAIGLAALVWAWPEKSWTQGPPPPEATVVFLIQGEAADKTLALVPADLLKKLDDLEKRPALPSQGVIWLAAHYQGKVQGSGAQLSAQLDFYTWGETTRVVLPFTGVDLRDGAFLDGAPAFPVAAPGKGGFLLSVRGQGMHRLVLPFSCRTTALADYQEVRFGLPRCPRTQVDIVLPAKVSGAHLVQSLGWERWSAGKEGLTLEAHLGRENALALRWQIDQPILAAETLDVREHYLWDLRPGSVGLQGLLQCQAAKGQVKALTLMLPPGLEVRHVDLGVAGAGSGPTVRRWFLTGKDTTRQLHLEPANPLTGPFLVHLTLATQFPSMPGGQVLRLPLLLKAKSTAGFLAYRAENGETADAFQNLGITALAPEEFAAIWSKVAGKELAAGVTRAFNFGRTAPQAALTLTYLPARPTVQTAMNWHVSGSGARFLATIDLSATDDLPLVELVVPPGFTVDQVSGAHVHSWSRTGAQVQIWLDQARKQSKVEVKGWSQAFPKLSAAKPGLLILPALQFPQAKQTPGVWSVAWSPDLALEVSQARSLERSPAPAQPETLEFRSIGADPELTVLLRTKPVPWQVQLLTLAQERDQVNVEILGRARHPEGVPASLTLRLPQNALDDPVLDLSPPLKVEHRRAEGEHRWLIHIPANPPQPLTWRLRGRKVVQPGSVWTFPRLQVVGGKIVDHQLAWLGPPLQKVTARNADIVKKEALPDQDWRHQRWTSAAQSWQTTKDDWALEGMLPKGELNPPVHLVLNEHATAASNQGHWHHQARYDLLLYQAAELSLQLPDGARMTALFVDGQPAPWKQQAANTIAVFLAESEQLRTLQVCWKQPGDNRIPHTASPQLPGVAAGPTLQSLHVPPGATFAGAPPPLAPWETSLARCQAYLDAAHHLHRRPLNAANGLPPALIALHEHALRHAAAAEHWLTYAALPAAEAERGRQALKQARDTQAELAKVGGYEKQFKDWLAQAINAPPADNDAALLPGAPLVWRRLPQARDLTLDDPAAAPWLLSSTAIVVLIGGLFVLTVLPGGLRLARATWPEQLALLSIVGLVAWGPSWIGLGLLAAAILARLILALGWLAKHRPAPSASS